MRCWARYLFYAVVGVLGIGQMIAACGQKGPLYLPEESATSAPAPAPDRAPARDPSAETADAIDDDVPVAPPAPP